MISLHRAAGTWSRAIDLYLALTEFARQKFIQGGFPAEKIVVKPNFVEEAARPGGGHGDDAIFVGRLSPEKGIETLLEAWSLLPGSTRLKIVGDGPLSERVARAARDDPRLEWLGQRTKAEVEELIQQAAVMIVPSICYETFGRAIIEAYVQGVPVIASRLGAMAELVADQRTGLLFEPGSAAALAHAVTCFLADPDRRQRMRLAARQEYEARYTAEQNYQFLRSAYERALGLKDAGQRGEASGPERYLGAATVSSSRSMTFSTETPSASAR
jgi:glycosyltransferase involved in cell wall biosynthesis